MNMLGITFAALLLAATTAASAEVPSDAQISSIVVTANQVDIDAGRLAESKSRVDAVRAFARQMVADHLVSTNRLSSLLTKLKVVPEDNPTSQSLKKGGDDNLKSLGMLKGAAFDKAYIDHEIAYHAQVIDAIDKILIPNAQNAELKALLVSVRPAFVGHLEHAKQIQATLGKN